MNLKNTYLELIFVKNKINYLFVIISLIASYVLISVTMIYMEKILALSNEQIYNNIQYLYISISTLIYIGGIVFIISQYHTILENSIKDYCILKVLGATMHNITLLIMLQMIFLIIISVPMGLWGGYIATSIILSLLGDFSANLNITKWIESYDIFLASSCITCCCIILAGIYLKVEVRKSTYGVDIS